MENTISDTTLNHVILNLTDRGNLIDFLEKVLELNKLLTIYDEEFWRKDTVSLGYKDELHRIVAESIKDKDINSFDGFEAAFENVFATLENDEFYGDCYYSIIEVGNDLISVAYCVGGQIN